MRLLSILLMAALPAFPQNYASYNNQPIARTSFLRSQWNGRNVLGDPSLVAYWPMTNPRGQIGDYSGNGIAATQSGPYQGTFAGKLSAYAPYFNSGAFNSFAVSPNPSISVPFTVSAWAHPNNPVNNFNRIMETNYQTGFLFGLNSGSTAWQIIVDNPSLGSCVGGSIAGSAAAWPADAWQLVTATYDGTNANLYVNGALVAGPCSMPNPGTRALGLAIGGCYISSYCASNGSGWWDGQFQDIRIYSRLLSAAEIAALYAAQNH